MDEANEEPNMQSDIILLRPDRLLQQIMTEIKQVHEHLHWQEDGTGHHTGVFHQGETF